MKQFKTNKRKTKRLSAFLKEPEGQRDTVTTVHLPPRSAQAKQLRIPGNENELQGTTPVKLDEEKEPK